MNSFFILDENPWEELGGGIKRKIVAYTDDLMAVHLCLIRARLAILILTKFTTKIGYVVRGSFEAEIEGERKYLKKAMLTSLVNTWCTVRLH